MQRSLYIIVGNGINGAVVAGTNIVPGACMGEKLTKECCHLTEDHFLTLKWESLSQEQEGHFRV